jgi:hypothetical protein
VEPDRSKDLDLAEFLRLLPQLDAADLTAISAAYSTGDDAARKVARSVASAAAKRRGLLDELNELQGSIIQWAGSDIPRSATFTFADVRPDLLLGDVRRDTVPALLDAATALLLGDALTEAQRAVLLDPLSAAVE